uniref:Obscurin, cytoskeletal calmodulin and titin-interacting RhoGEF b n=1 Tax=Salarias fasciatus TaxID=181472 RepID=A0A672FB87_SALFA
FVLHFTFKKISNQRKKHLGFKPFIVLFQLQSVSFMPLFFKSKETTEIPRSSTSQESVQKEVKASLSQKASLSCEVADSKTEVKWYKDGKLLTSSKTIHTESKGKSRQLVLDSVEKQDSGEYVCEAGTEKLKFRLQVEGELDESCFYDAQIG